MANNKKIEEQVKNNPGALVQQIVKEVIAKKAIDISFEDDDESQWSIVRVHDEDEDQELAIRCLPDEKWVLQFGFYDDKDDYIELLQPLGQTETALIPPGLQKVMRKVLASEEGLRVPGSLLAK